MRKAYYVALREFTSTVFTKGFILGVVLTPVLFVVVIVALSLLMNVQPPRVYGRIAVVDQSGVAADEIVRRFSPEGLEAERRRERETITRTMRGAGEALNMGEGRSAMFQQQLGAQVDRRFEQGPVLQTEVLPADVDVEAIKDELRDVNVRAQLGPTADLTAPLQRIGVAVIPPGALTPDADGRYGEIQLFLAPRLDFEVQRIIEGRLAQSVVDARISTDARFIGRDLDPDGIRAIVRPPEVFARAMTPQGEQRTSGLRTLLIPAGFMMLLLLSVMTAGQYLLTSTVEEKGSRVMEVLLSAVSPMELMVGKIVGQMCVGLVILTIYSGIGIVSLIITASDHLLNPINIVYLVIFFFVAFFLIAAFMAAIGSAVTELREAQTLATPIMTAMIVPWVLWVPISRAPNSTFATVTSFIPGLNPFVMIIRLAGSEPIPDWQIPASIGVGLLSVVVAAWAAAKVFRVGVLMYGKPPNFATLIRWIRMA